MNDCAWAELIKKLYFELQAQEVCLESFPRQATLVISLSSTPLVTDFLRKGKSSSIDFWLPFHLSFFSDSGNASPSF